jgi:tRNA (adenine37-N6)-methyltransferase
MLAITMKPIGTVRSSRKQIADDQWEREHAWIELDAAQFSADALLGLGEFSHVEVIFYMNRAAPERIEVGARHPRNNFQWPRVGIFAQRGKDRPNHIGITRCKIARIDGRKVYVQGLDAVDETPVLDLKPWVAEFGPRGELRQPPWVTELMTGYW